MIRGLPKVVRKAARLFHLSTMSDRFSITVFARESESRIPTITPRKVAFNADRICGSSNAPGYQRYLKNTFNHTPNALHNPIPLHTKPPRILPPILRRCTPRRAFQNRPPKRTILAWLRHPSRIQHTIHLVLHRSQHEHQICTESANHYVSGADTVRVIYFAHVAVAGEKGGLIHADFEDVVEADRFVGSKDG